MTKQTASLRIKRLHRKSAHYGEISLKDFAVELSQRGGYRSDDKVLVDTWLTNKAGPPKKRKETVPTRLTVEAPKKNVGKKKG